MSTSTLDFSKPLNASLPRQQLTLAEKLKDKDKFGISDWMKDCMDSLEAIGRYQFYNNLALRDNYRIVNKEFNIEHYYDKDQMYDFTTAVVQEFGVPYYLKHYDIIGKAVNQLEGEFVKRPDLFTVRASGVDIDNERIRIKTELVQTYIQQNIKREIDNKLLSQGIDPNRTQFSSEEEKSDYEKEIAQKYQELTPKSIEKYIRYDYRSAGEHWGQAVLSNDRLRFNFRELEKIEFRDMLIADRCFAHIYLTPIGYNYEYWNPINVFFHQVPDMPHCEDGDYVGRVFYLNKAKVIDRFGWRMTEEQIQMLYPQDSHDRSNGNVYGEFFNATMYPFPAYRDYSNIVTSLGIDPWNQSPVGNLPYLNNVEDTPFGFPNYQFGSGDLVQVTEAYWRSQRRIGQVKMINPDTQEPETFLVNDQFDPKLYGIEEIKNTALVDIDEDQQPLNSIIWTWVTHIWQGCKINANFAQSVEDRDRNAIYFDIKPCPFQFKGDYTPFSPKLPVIGGVFNNRNAKSNSLVDLLKPYQIAYNAFMNLAYGIAQRNNGKMALLDIRTLSNFKDWGGEEALQKALTIGREWGVIPLDTSMENMGPNQQQFSHYQVLDLDESEKIERLMKLAMVWEEQGFRQIGITPQRQGQTQASETATGVEQAVNNSYAITEPYFENFYNYKKRKLKALLDMAQFCAKNEKDIVLSYTTSDLGLAFVKTTGTEVMLSDLGVNIDNSQESIQELEFAKKLALENNTMPVPPSKLIAMIRLKSIADIQKTLEQAEEEAAKQQQAQQQHEMDLQNQKLKAESEEKDKQRAFDANENQLDRQEKLQEAAIKTMGFDTDTQNNGTIDSIDQAKLAIDQSKLEADRIHKQNDIFHKQLDSYRKAKLEQDKMEHEKELKDKEMAHRHQIENDKLKQIATQNKSQEKIERDSFKNDLTLQKQKHKSDMELKNKDKEILDKKLELEKFKVSASKEKLKHEVNQIKNKTEGDKKITDTKAHVAKEIGKIDINEAKKISDLNIKEKQETSKHKVEHEKVKGKIKLDVEKIKGAIAKKEAAKPKSPNK